MFCLVINKSSHTSWFHFGIRFCGTNMGKTQKPKAKNFSDLEKRILLELVEEEINIIEGNKNDGTMVNKKAEAWERVCEKF